MALSISPSLEFHGNDGPWSSFNLRLGTPPQIYRVLPATSQSTTWVVLPEGCGPDRPANCADLRGGIFSANQSLDASWARQIHSEENQFYALPFESEPFLPNYTANAKVGLDSFSLDWENPKTSLPLLNQTIAGYASPIPWLGTLGISGWRSTFDNFSVEQLSSLQYLKDNKSLPSLSWAYTAGAYNEVPQAFASLTFGGFDEARFDMDSALTVSFGQDSAFDLQLWIESIELNGRTRTNARSVSTFPALIDSLVPEIWLPQDTCDDFASTFGLMWNDTAQLYLVNETQHQDLLSQNPRVVFNLAANETFLDPISITLPYKAFDLEATYPLAGITDNTTTLRYFPLRPLNDNNKHSYLGRTFLQYAYVAADYENAQFFIGPTIFPTGPRTISLKNIESSNAKSGLSKGAIAGIAVGAILALALLAGLGFWLYKKRRGKVLPADQMTFRTGSIGGETMTGDVEMSSVRGEWYNKPQSPIPPGSPEPEDERAKPELDATTTAVNPVDKPMGRVELDAGSDAHRRPAHRHQSSWGSAGSGVSPISGNERIRSNYFGEPSPPLEIASSGASSPPLSGRLRPGGRASGGHTRDHSTSSPQGLHELPE